ncbi:4Fe-4S dicluster domain-containing protein [Variovorax sp. J22R133]|uniref:4Fe-4S dicluster domain-containing protein n=1 Tax=Variovorax brevis TaxID=3053503 RepID=UPI002577FA93|nr:4Fe-4S dicluster domain-containing protein [Variovorax sp. J22R133]MDM0116275.1 4Fe-4S dicluster domain-containing protein [Variovorax sp. J22R133]
MYHEILGDRNCAPGLQINAQNCVPCTVCDIKDPTQKIDRAVLESGPAPTISAPDTDLRPTSLFCIAPRRSTRSGGYIARQRHLALQDAVASVIAADDLRLDPRPQQETRCTA